MTPLKQNQKVHHLYNTKGTWADSRPDFRGQRGVITIVSQQLDSVPDQFSFGVSYCQPGDNFSKKIGIETAIERMGLWWCVHRRRPLVFYDIRANILTTLLMNPAGIIPYGLTGSCAPIMPQWAEDTVRWYLAGY